MTTRMPFLGQSECPGNRNPDNGFTQRLNAHHSASKTSRKETKRNQDTQKEKENAKNAFPSIRFPSLMKNPPPRPRTNAQGR